MVYPLDITLDGIPGRYLGLLQSMQKAAAELAGGERGNSWSRWAGGGCGDSSLQTCHAEEGDKPPLSPGGGVGGGNTRGNGFKVKEGTSAVGGGKFLGGREQRAPALGSLAAAGCGSPPLRAPRIG